jgi:hypothetical protein
MRALAPVLSVLVVLVAPVSLGAWGMEVHRHITGRALDALPPELKPFFAVQRDFIIEHSVDPDLWRVVGLKGDRGDEDPNHFIDIDGLDDPRPFANVPRDWDGYVAKYGLERVNRIGRLPWRIEEIYGLLVKRLQEAGKGSPAYAADNARYLAAVLAHYIEDATQPFHTVLNHNGQLTGQDGIHSRFETQLVLRNLSALRLAPVAIRPFTNMRDFAFETIVASEARVQGVLDADRKATVGREFYDDDYFAAFLAGARPTLERRLGDAASGVASALVSAWIAAGKPVLPVDRATTPARIRR